MNYYRKQWLHGSVGAGSRLWAWIRFAWPLLSACLAVSAAQADEPIKTAKWQQFRSDFYFQNFDLHSGYQRTQVWSGVFTDLANRAHNVSNFYAPKRPTFEGHFDLVHVLSRAKDDSSVQEPTILIKHRFHFDAGYSSALYRAKPYISWSPQVTFLIGERSTVQIGAGNLLWLGGDVKESPCLDGFRREFHCGTGLPWTDYRPFANTNYVPTRTVFLQYAFFF